MVFSHPLIKRKGHSLPGINETSDLRSTDSSSSIGHDGNSGFSSGDSIHVIPGISEFLKLMVPSSSIGQGGNSIHVIPGISEFLKLMVPSSWLGQGGNLGFSSGDSIHVIPGISEFLMSMVPVEHFGRVHVTPGISELLISIKSSIGHGGKATFRIKRMCHCKLQFGFFY